MPRGRGTTRARGTTNSRGARSKSNSAKEQLSSAKSQTTKPKKKASKPVVISLDVTYSSDELDLDESDYETPEEQKAAERPLLTPSPPADGRNGRGIMSDSEYDSEELASGNKDPPSIKRPKIQDSPNKCMDDDSSDDIFAIDFNYRSNAIKEAMKEIKEMEKKKKICSEENPQEDVNSKEIEAMTKNTKSFSEKKHQDDVNSSITVELSDEEKETGDDVIIDESLSFSGSPLSPMPEVKLRKRKLLKRNKETTKVMKAFQALAKEMSSKDNDLNNESFNQSTSSDIMVLSDDESISNTEMTLKVRWGSNYLRLPVKKMQKFSYIYQSLAERFNVAVSQVVLNHNDKIISPEISPHELGLTVADIVEGGVQSGDFSVTSKLSQTNNYGTIRLKVQNAEKKGVVNIHISRYDKMQVLMQKYADEKKVELSQLKFRFDGEKLDPNETPDLLDLDGDECIDVFHT